MKIGGRIKIDKYDLIMKLFGLISLVLVIYGNLFWITIVSLRLISFVIVLLFTFTVFYQSLRNLYFNIRTKAGEINTSRYGFDIKFKEHGGIEGYKEIKEEHIAIIFPSESRKRYPNIDNKEITLLTDYYKERNEHYKLYFCYLADDFISIVKSQYVYGIHIFGHGRIYCLLFEDGYLIYRELKNTQPKEFIAQWHCNHTEGKSLGEYIGKKYYVPYGKRGGFQNKRDIKKLIKGKLNWKVNKELN